MTKVEKGTRHRLYVFTEKKQTNTVKSAKWEATARAHDAFRPLAQA